MDLEALAIDVGNLQDEGFMEPEAQALDGGAGDRSVEGCGRLEEPPDLLDTEHGGETMGVLSAQERQGVPVALEDVLGEEAEAAGADAHGRGGEAVDVFPVQDGALQLLCRDAVRGWVVARRAQADCTDRGCLRPFALATELESRKHLLT
jgi:hypothetical protein